MPLCDRSFGEKNRVPNRCECVKDLPRPPLPCIFTDAGSQLGSTRHDPLEQHRLKMTNLSGFTQKQTGHPAQTQLPLKVFQKYNLKGEKKKQTLILFCVCTMSIFMEKVIKTQVHVSVTSKVLPWEREAKINLKTFPPKFKSFKCPDRTSFKTGVSKVPVQESF